MKWLAGQYRELGVNPERIAIGGPSAGGGLTVGLALATRDRGEVNVAFQLLIHPMIDDRNVEPPGPERPDPSFGAEVTISSVDRHSPSKPERSC